MKRIVSTITAAAACLWLTAASALGLGEIQVRSHLNERFDAVIPLTSLGDDDAGNLRVSLAAGEEFARAGIERPQYLSSLHFAVKNDGAPRIEITSSQIAREPYLQLLMEVRSGGSRIVRQYTVLLDPPELAARESAVSAAAPTPAPVPAQTAAGSNPAYATFVEVEHPAPPADERRTPVREPVAPKKKPELRPAPAPTAPIETAPSAAPSAASTAESPSSSVALSSTTAAPADTAAPDTGALYGPVKSAETLWSVATRMRGGSDVTMDQTLLAIYNSNPRAFDGGINTLLKGAMLHVPSIDEIQAVSPAAAHDEVMRLRGLRASGRAVTPAPRPRRPIIEPLQITPPPPAGTAQPGTAEPAPAAPATQTPSAVVAETPATDATTKPAATKPAAEAPAASADTAATPPAPAAGDTVPAEGADAAASAIGTPPATPPAVAAPKPVAPPPAIAPAPKRAGESLLQTLLIPLILGLILLFCVAYLFSRWRARRKPPIPPVVTLPRRPLTATSASEMAIAAAGVAVAARKLSPQEELDLLQSTIDDPVLVDGAVTQQLQTQQLEPSVQPDDPSVHLSVEPTRIDPEPTLPPVDFDLTGQFASQTVQIDLDANDPVSEADFHLAYGLYDEAALLLRQAALEHPERTDIEIKLAEVYFAAGKTADFEQTATALKPKLSAAEWQKLAIMGQQLDPGSSQFSAAGQAPLETDLDLSFDVPAEPALDAPPTSAETLMSLPEPARLDFTFDTAELQLATAASETPPPAAVDNGLDFKLDDLELPSLDAAPEAPPPPPVAVQDDALDFDLGSFDLEPPPASAPQQTAAVDDPLNSIDFDLGEFDAPPEPVADASSAASAAPSFDAPIEEFDFDSVSAESTDISGDEAGTKLDLARAYVDMGDNEMASSLLNEVLAQGSDAQKHDAQTLLNRLG